MRVYIDIEDGEKLRRYCLDHSWMGAVAKVNRIEEREDYLDVWNQIYRKLQDDELDESALNDAIWLDEKINKIIESRKELKTRIDPTIQTTGRKG